MIDRTWPKFSFLKSHLIKYMRKVKFYYKFNKDVCMEKSTGI